MRVVEITIPRGKRDSILRVLDDEGIDYVVTEETSGRDYTAVVSFPLPTGAVEPVLDRLRDAGLPADAYTIIIDAETVVSRRFDRLEQRYAETGETTGRIAREEIRTRAANLAPDFRSYIIMVMVSVVIATAGLLLNSAAVVVGAMVIAPLIGPAMATSVGTVLQDRDLFIRGTKLQAIGFGIAVVSAAAFALFVKSTHLVPPGIDVASIDQIRERLAPDFLALAIALGAGVAGAFSLSAGVSSALVGVMIAVALVPPTAVIGIGIAWGRPVVVVGSLVLVLLNFVSINLAALVTLWYQGYRPEYWFHEDEARRATFKRIAVLAVLIIGLSVFLGGVTYSSYQTAATEDDIRGDVTTVLGEHPDVTLIDLEIQHEESIRNLVVGSAPERVIITVGHPAGESSPDLVDDLASEITSDHDVVVEVRFVETHVRK